MKITHSSPTLLLTDVPAGEVITCYNKHFLVLDATAPLHCEGNVVNLQTGEVTFIDPVTTVTIHADAELVIY